MKRISIRDRRSPNDVKPRLFDFLINDDGTQEIEVKNGKSKNKILLSDLEDQIKEAQTSQK